MEEHGFFGGILRKMQTFAEKAKKEKYMEQIQRDIVLYKIRDCATFCEKKHHKKYILLLKCMLGLFQSICP